MFAWGAIMMMAMLVAVLLRAKKNRAQRREEKIKKDLQEKAIQQMAKEEAMRNADSRLDHVCTRCNKRVTVTDALCGNKFNDTRTVSSTGWYRPVHLECNKAELNQ